MYEAKILLDSMAPCKKRLTTFEVTFPRFVLPEWNTHRMFSRNAASSRAIPTQKIMDRIKADPAMPVFWGKNQKGMQAEEELNERDRDIAKSWWLNARDYALANAKVLQELGVHKQIVNRILEPYLWITVIVSATEFENFFNQRCHPDAQPEIKHIADMMADLYYSSTPVDLEAGDWHTPLIYEEDRELIQQYILPHTDPEIFTETTKRVSVARCARVSYLTHDGKRSIENDIDLFDRLLGGSGGAGHWSPLEHVAQALDRKVRSGNFIGWKQFRKEWPNENHTKFTYRNK